MTREPPLEIVLGRAIEELKASISAKDSTIRLLERRVAMLEDDARDDHRNHTRCVSRLEYAAVQIHMHSCADVKVRP